jgi:hypothetical protein
MNELSEKRNQDNNLIHDFHFFKTLIINLTKEVNGLYNENYKTLVGKKLKRIQKMKRHPMFVDWKN